MINPLLSLKTHKNFETAMPFLWKYCNKTKTPSADWCYENKLSCGQSTWGDHYPVSLIIIFNIIIWTVDS